MSARYFYGWNVVGATFVMALGSFGLGFYGIAVYVATLQQLHGWSASMVSAPVTVYYVAGALLTAAIASVYERFGSRIVVAAGAVVMAAGVPTLGGVGEPARTAPAGPPAGGDRRWRRDALRTWRFWSVSAPFALGLAAQVGVLTHLVALVRPALGTGGAARAVSTTTAAALVGRLATGFVVDKVNRRLVACATLVVQLAGLALLSRDPSPVGVYAGCVLFGLGVGNLTTLPGLILAVEWPRQRFSGLVGLVVGINQLTFAFGPSLVGVVRDWAGSYGAALGACAALQAISATLILLGPGPTAKT